MVKSILHVIAFALLSLPLVAQTVHTFSYGPYGSQNPQSPFTLIDGNPPDEAIGYSGSIQIRYNFNPWWGMLAPNGPYNCAGQPVCGWGFPNNGQLLTNTPSPNTGQLIWDNPGCGPKIAGCTAHTDTTIPFVGYGAGVTVTVHDTWIVHMYPCRRYCRGYYPQVDNNGGTGTATYTSQ